MRACFLVILLFGFPLFCQPPFDDGGTGSADAAEPEASIPVEDANERTALNLLGEVDTDSGEGRRNENVQLTLINNNVLKELNERMGITATVITEFRVDQNYFGAEFGGSPKTALHLSTAGGSGMHGTAFWTHDNSVFNARSFFQVGDVKPAHFNDYGFEVGFPIWKRARLSINASQRKLRGQVNGNVLVPTAEERVPLTTDPADRAIVEAIFGAYPEELPNRTDINPRALNTNAPQNINNDRVGGTLDQDLGSRDRLIARYGFTLQNVEAFQLVGGQNPDTTTRNHVARLTWNRVWNPTTTTDFSVGYDRIGSLLVPDETSLGPFYVFSRELESIGPGGEIPIDRSQNLYRYAGAFNQLRGNHTLIFGFDLLRAQTNGSESNDHRGLMSFRSDFDRDLVTNLRMGTPSSYTVAIGNVHRGFRNWDMQYYAGDTWRVTPRFTLNLGLRYRPITRPTEVNNLSQVPYSSDLNNFAPSFGLAYQLPGRWGVMRAAYSLHYGEIFPATYMQSRFNPPGNLNVVVNAPKLSDPLGRLSESDLDPTGRSSIYDLAPDLRTPYEHLYSFDWEFSLHRDWVLELGYTGSRTHKLLTAWFLNRARVVEGVEQISDTINDRRPDQRYYDIFHIHNGSRGYFDAAKVTLRIPRWRGFTVDGSYWFSKAIDLGADYTNTASGRDIREGRSPSEFEFQKEKKALSSFDQPHAMLWHASYETPALAGRNRWIRSVFESWQIGSVMLFKSGTPFSVRSGSDSPGWGNVDGAGSDNPILLDPSILGRSIDHPDTSVEYLPASAFTTMQPTDPRGNLGFSTFRKDGVVNINMALSKAWRLRSEKEIVVRGESLNLLNHPQFGEPGHSLSSEDFAVITNTLNDGRAFRLTVEFAF